MPVERNIITNIARMITEDPDIMMNHDKPSVYEADDIDLGGYSCAVTYQYSLDSDGWYEPATNDTPASYPENHIDNVQITQLLVHDEVEESRPPSDPQLKEHLYQLAYEYFDKVIGPQIIDDIESSNFFM